MEAVTLLGIIYAARRTITTVESKMLPGEAGPLSRVTFGEQKIKGKQNIGKKKNLYKVKSTYIHTYGYIFACLHI